MQLLGTGVRFYSLHKPGLLGISLLGEYVFHRETLLLTLHRARRSIVKTGFSHRHNTNANGKP
ncbi:hypothetical protein MCEGE14_02108 [Burkholderiaceae bacterium]